MVRQRLEKNVYRLIPHSIIACGHKVCNIRAYQREMTTLPLDYTLGPLPA